MPRPTNNKPAHPPQQERSREKLERILAACEELLDERLFEQLTMGAIAERAQVAVGTLYTRFRSKEELLPALFARHDLSVGARVGGLLEKVQAEPDLRTRIEQIVGFAVDYHTRHRGLLRALTMYVRAHPESVPAQTFAKRGDQYGAVARALVGDGKGVAQRSGESAVQAAEFALGLVNSVCREQLLFDDVTPLKTRRRSRAVLKRRLAETVWRDLTA